MTQDRYWLDYFDKVCTEGPPWMDYSNERIHLQTFGTVIEAADRLLGKRVLDVGCGRGQLCRIAQVLGAASVTGVDRVPSTIEALAAAAPGIDWRAGDVTDPTFRASLGEFDSVFMLEVMQYLPVPSVLDWVMDLLRPGGVFVAMIPNERCPIIQRTKARFTEGTYDPPSTAAIEAWTKTRADLQAWSARGLRFQADQRVVPYELTSWSQDLGGAAWGEPPNRIELVFKKADSSADSEKGDRAG